MSGGTEISCTVRTRGTHDQDALLLDKLPRTSRVVSVSAHLLLRNFVLPDAWQGLAWLSPEQADRLRPPPVEAGDGPIDLDEGDKALLRALNLDGRAPYAELAAATGWSETTVKRRLYALRGQGILSYQLDVPPSALGFGTEARLWIAAPPAKAVEVGAALARHPEIAFAALTTGPTNLVAALNCRDPLDLGRYLTERLAALEAITTMETAPIIRTVKRGGSPRL